MLKMKRIVSRDNHKLIYKIKSVNNTGHVVLNKNIDVERD